MATRKPKSSLNIKVSKELLSEGRRLKWSRDQIMAEAIRRSVPGATEVVYRGVASPTELIAGTSYTARELINLGRNHCEECAAAIREALKGGQDEVKLANVLVEQFMKLEPNYLIPNILFN